jgi:hypothetical protein
MFFIRSDREHDGASPGVNRARPKGGNCVRNSEILHRNSEAAKGNRARPKLNLRSARFSHDLTKLATALTKDGRVKHFQYLNWSRALLSKSRYMCGRQCQKKLWLTVFVSTRTLGRVYAIVDNNGKREVKTLATGLNSPNGIALHNGTLYIAEIDKISKIGWRRPYSARRISPEPLAQARSRLRRRGRRARPEARGVTWQG